MPPEVIVTESELPKDVMAAIVEGRKIEAIKMLRESTGLGLANAKVLIDRASRVHGPKKALNPAMDAPSGPGKLIASVVALLILAASYYYITGA